MITKSYPVTFACDACENHITFNLEEEEWNRLNSLLIKNLPEYNGMELLRVINAPHRQFKGWKFIHERSANALNGHITRVFCCDKCLGKYKAEKFLYRDLNGNREEIDGSLEYIQDYLEELENLKEENKKEE